VTTLKERKFRRALTSLTPFFIFAGVTKILSLPKGSLIQKWGFEKNKRGGPARKQSFRRGKFFGRIKMRFKKVVKSNKN